MCPGIFGVVTRDIDTGPCLRCLIGRSLTYVSVLSASITGNDGGGGVSSEKGVTGCRPCRGLQGAKSMMTKQDET